MTQDVSQLRDTAVEVGKWLVEKKQRPDDAVALLCAWAVTGPNDAKGQELLAEALRIDPSAQAAQEAFERMEGIAGDHRTLDGAVASFGAEQLQKLAAEMRRPTFRRAQMGFNNNVKYQGAVYHVQTEDSGLDAPHIITHLFADGGRVIKSHRRSYEGEVARDDVSDFVRGLMKAQHMEMVLFLRQGKFDRVIEGAEVGGLQELHEPPNVDIRKLASKKKQRAEADEKAVAEAPTPEASAAAAQAALAALDPARAAAAAQQQQIVERAKAAEQAGEPAYFALAVLRSLTGGPERYAPRGNEAIIGSRGSIELPGEVFCHPNEAVLTWRDNSLWLADLEGGNGVFLRIRTPVELELGDEFVVGDQLLRVDPNPIPDDHPAPDPTYFYSSPKWPSSFRVVQVFEGGADGACVVARGNTLQIGSAIGDLVFSDDPLVSEQHCLIEEQAGTIVLTDLGSRTGVFVRIRGEQEVVSGDELLVGRTRLVCEVPPAA